ARQGAGSGEVPNDRVLTSRHAGRGGGGRHGGSGNEHGDFRAGTAPVRADAGAARRRRVAVLSLPARRGRPQNLGRRLGERGDGGGFPGVAGDRRRADVARPRGGTRTALARQRGGGGLWGQGPMSRHHHQPARPVADRRLHAGDVWYFPRGFGHSIQGIGSEDCLFVLVFDNGYFSEFGTFSITDWVGHTPPEVLAKYFGVPA